MEFNGEVEKIEHRTVESDKGEVLTGKVTFSNSDKGQRFVLEGDDSITVSYTIGEKTKITIGKQNKTIQEATAEKKEVKKKEE